MIRALHGDCRDVLPTLAAGSVHCVVTSPPYFGLRDYGVAGQIGLEPTPDAYVAELVAVFREVWRVLRNDGTLWLNLGDSYSGSMKGSFKSDAGWKALQERTKAKGYTPGIRARTAYSRASLTPPGLKPKDLMMLPARVALALQADGWFLRSDIIWAKPNPMPESVTDRPTSAHEHVFLLAKRSTYFYDAEAVREAATDAGKVKGATNGYVQHSAGGHNKDGLSLNGAKPVAEYRNLRNVWTIASQPFAEAHFATFPAALVEPCVKAGCPVGGVVLDPFSGAGTVGLVADRLGRDAVLIELNGDYDAMARARIVGDAPLLAVLKTEVGT